MKRRSIGIEIVNLGTNHGNYDECYPIDGSEPADDCI